MLATVALRLSLTKGVAFREDSRPKSRSNRGSAGGAGFHTHRSPPTGASIKISFWNMRSIAWYCLRGALQANRAAFHAGVAMEVSTERTLTGLCSRPGY